MDGQAGGHGGGPGGRVEGHHVPLRVLAHVQPQHRCLRSKVAGGEGLGELGLADASGAAKEHGGNGAVEIREADVGPLYGPGDGGDGVVLPDDPPLEQLLQPR